MGGTVSASDTNGQGSDVWKYKGDFPDTLLCDLLLPGGWDYDGAPDNLSDFTFSEMAFKIRLIRLTIKQIRVTYRKLWNIFACWIQCREENRYDCRYQSPKWKTVEWLKPCLSTPAWMCPQQQSKRPALEWRNCGEASQNTQTKMFGWWHLFLWRLSVGHSRL